MPKKYIGTLKDYTGQSSSRSVATSSRSQHGLHPGNGGDGSSQLTVNEKLNQLRKVESQEATARKRQLAESVNQRSVPPSLSGILGVPESAPPKPKMGSRINARDRMRTPGPPPPGSWLGYDRAAEQTLTIRDRGIANEPVSQPPGPKNAESPRPIGFLRFAKLLGQETGERDVGPSSLKHLLLKQTAQNWDLMDEADYPALAEVPLHLRLQLIAYIGSYGPPITLSALRALVQGPGEVTQLDMTGTVEKGQITLKNLAKLLQESKLAERTDEVAESWDEEESEEPLRFTRPFCQFANLTHLCLSHPPPQVLWKDLLNLAKHTPHVTHLSLAFWPRPTLTPHWSTAFVSSMGEPDMFAGGSMMYSALDKDFAEPAVVLRQFSASLLRLQWLDLEGCHKWLNGLVYEREITQPGVYAPFDAASPWPAGPKQSSILTTTWKNVTYINVSIGWKLSKQSAELYLTQRRIRRLPTWPSIMTDLEECMTGVGSASGFRNEATRRQHLDTSRVYFDKDEDTMARRAAVWAEEQLHALLVSRLICDLRLRAGLRPPSFEFGWSPKKWSFHKDNSEMAAHT